MASFDIHEIDLTIPGDVTRIARSMKRMCLQASYRLC
jgi:hypothetical protein